MTARSLAVIIAITYILSLVRALTSCLTSLPDQVILLLVSLLTLRGMTTRWERINYKK